MNDDKDIITEYMIENNVTSDLRQIFFLLTNRTRVKNYITFIHIQENPAKRE